MGSTIGQERGDRLEDFRLGRAPRGVARLQLTFT
jgi:hypothetical protein